MSTLTKNEATLLNKLQECHQEKSKWITVLYLLVTKFGTEFKLVIPNVDRHGLVEPSRDCPIEKAWLKAVGEFATKNANRTSNP